MVASKKTTSSFRIVNGPHKKLRFGRAQERRIASEAGEAPQVYTDRISGSIFYAVYGLVFLFGFGLLLDRMGALRSGVIGLCLAILGGFTAKTFVWI